MFDLNKYKNYKINKNKQKLKAIVKEMSTYLPLDPIYELALENYPPNVPPKCQTKLTSAVFRCPDIMAFTVKIRN